MTDAIRRLSPRLRDEDIESYDSHHVAFARTSLPTRKEEHLSPRSKHVERLSSALAQQ
jgi:hypothetical protein